MTPADLSPQLEQLLDTASRLVAATDAEAILMLVEQPLDWARVRQVAGTAAVLVAADDTTCTVRVEGTAAAPIGDDRVVPYDQIDRAKTVFVWGAAPKPGKAGSGAKKPGSKRADRPADSSASKKAPKKTATVNTPDNHHDNHPDNHHDDQETMPS